MGCVRALALGIVTGAADADPSAVGTYASAGATLGTASLWVAPVRRSHSTKRALLPSIVVTTLTWRSRTGITEKWVRR